eukprot:TRINITY_DN4967_c1_g1_i1.p2 TRINITY_DN4967_c1_g1~~TRINITY_DN4967_c1_g1_i1.p2  ORF type:complete len:244 (+),score=107.86 TRINITY_DN4967_c1_g1_i1:115-846(+)
MVDSDRDEPGAAATPYLVALVQLVSDSNATDAPPSATETPAPSAGAGAPDTTAAAPPDAAAADAPPATAGAKTDAAEAAAKKGKSRSDGDAPPAVGPPLTSLALWQLERNVWVALQDVLRLSNKLYDRTLELNASLLKVAPPNAPTDAGLLDARTELPASLRGNAGGSDGRAGGEAAETVDDARVRSEAFSFAVAAILDQPIREQQRLLQTRDTGVRLRSLLRLLDAARRYLAAQSQIKDALS